MAVLDFQAYLNSFVSTHVTEDWGDGRYTATTAELPLQVQTIVEESQPDDQHGRGERPFAPSEESIAESEDKKAQPKREQFAVLDGLRKLALAENQHVLLVGRPGSGKSTALRRLFWEEAQACLKVGLPDTQDLESTSNPITSNPSTSNLEEPKWSGGKNIQVGSGRLMQVNDPNAPVIQAGDNSTFTIHINSQADAGWRNRSQPEFITGSTEAIQKPIPVLLELRDFRDGDLLEWIRQKLARKRWRLNADDLTDLLLDGRILLLFDGVNELPLAEAWQKLDSFRRDFTTTPMIFSTRELGTGADLGIEKKLEMLPLTEPQMRQFIHKRLPGQAEQLLRQMQGRLRELAETPLLLKMLCDVVAAQPNGQIPKSRGELFRQFAQDYDRIKHRGVLPVSEGFLQFRDELLQRLALAMMSGGEKPTEFVLQIDRVQAEQLFEQDLAGRVDAPGARAREWLGNLIEHHLLQLTSDLKIEFHHQLFQEYYAAESLLLQFEKNFKEGKKDEIKLKFHYLNLHKWTECISMVLSLIQPEDLVEKIIKLALDIDYNLGSFLIGNAKLDLHEKLLEKIEDLSIPEWLKITLLGESGSELSIVFLEKYIDSQDISTRKEVLGALGKINTDSAIKFIIKSLEDTDNGVRNEAMYILHHSNLQSKVYHLLCALENCNKSVRWRAAYALEYSKNEIAIPALVKAIQDPNHHVRYNAACALGNLNPRKTAPILKNLLKHPDSNIIKCTTFALAKMNDDIATNILLETLENSAIEVQLIVISDLAKIKTEIVIIELIKRIQDPSDLIRRKISNALIKIGTDSVAIKLLEIIETLTIEALQLSIKVLEGIGSNLTILILIKLLDSQNHQIRRLAAISLGKIGSYEAVSPLIRALKDCRTGVRRSAAYALGAIGSMNAKPYLEKTLNDPKKTVCRGALWALKSIEKKSDIIELTNTINSKKSINAKKAAIKILEINRNVLINELLSCLNDTNHIIRRRGIYILSEVINLLKSHEIQNFTPVLVKLIEDPDDYMRRKSVKLMPYVYPSNEVIESVIQSIKHNNPHIRVKAFQAFQELSIGGMGSLLPDLTSLISTRSGREAFRAIKLIQSRCGFYNYEAWKAAQKRREEEAARRQQSGEQKNLTQNFYAPVYGVAGNIEGNMMINSLPKQDVTDSTNI